MEYFINCNSSTLAPYTTPLDELRAAHLYRRLGFSASVQTINAAVGQTAGALVDNLVNQALAVPPIPAPTWADWTNADYPADDDLAGQLRRTQQEEFATAYGNALLDNELRDRMSFFWSNHFVTEIDVYDCNSFLYYYINCLQRNALGNFRTFVSEIGLTSAMLYYLDGVRNRGNNPNENYARELYELFTLGEGNNYTEEDIIETAKAISGYTERGEEGCTQVTFNPEDFNTENKTIFGQTGNWGYDDVINILFTERPNEIAWFICKKLYEFFVHPDSDDADGNAETIINGMAATFTANNFEIAPVLSQLFKSQHFFDEDAIGVIIKSPFDLYLNLLKETGFTYDDGTVINVIDASRMIGQTLFDPFDVAGWQRDRQWINTNFIIGRWLTSEVFLERFFQADPEQFRTLGIEATGANGATETDPDIVARAIIDKFLPKGLLTDIDYNRAITVFREPYEDNNVYETGSWNMTLDDANTQVYLLLLHLVREPEFQLK
ncbi:DUF1800 domain-containing protein [Flagellimonas pacifica]|uniref:Uncharacterized conserved protein, DUF1800 family n=1 Tax=Flagellimonas pacifica TaxID=1247520 RepID=A0A285MIN2_9FLAO|nr:DUF1800 domain-containing protein [Allomuricauda parva]SNY95361.1 Uncharacterized conserved protein, DUF1800 family [Allomuricauda parva]